MKFKVVFFLLIFFGCKDSDNIKETTKVSIKEVKLEDSRELVNDLMAQIDSLSSDSIPTLKKVENDDDNCFFDQTTQTDEFLKGIKELEGYRWNQKTKTATINLPNETLEIYRGGCDHFSVIVDFVFKRQINFDEEKEMIFEKIVWITNLIKDFDGKAVKESIEGNKLDIKVDDSKRHIHFMDQRLYESYYMVFVTYEDSSEFQISYSLD